VICQTPRKEHKEKEFGSRVLRRGEGTGERRKLHNEELHNLYSSPDIMMIKGRRIGWDGHDM
jgi:hypothetical protein